MYELDAGQLDLVAGGDLNVHLGTDAVWVEGGPKDYWGAAQGTWNWFAVNVPLSAPGMIARAGSLVEKVRWGLPD